MRRGLKRRWGWVAVAAVAWPASAWAGDVLVWFAEELPEEAVRKKAERKTGGAAHLLQRELAWPEPVATLEDDVRIQALVAAVEDARARWLEFEVEYDIAVALEDRIGAVDVIRDDADREAILIARLVQGAAVYRSFHRDDFVGDERAAVFRASWGSGVVNRPWAAAVALAGDRAVVRDDLGDGSSIGAFEAVRAEVTALEAGTVVLPAPYAGATWYLDGREVTEGSHTVGPGDHYLHADVGGQTVGRQRLVVEPGSEVQVGLPISPGDLEVARGQVLAGTTTGLSGPVSEALEAVGASHDGAVFVGATDGRGHEVLPYTRGAELASTRLVSVVGYAEGGFGMLTSPLFDGNNETGPGLQIGGGVELGIHALALAGALDLAVTPGSTITHGNADLTDNVTTSVFPQPWLGLGGYVLRPEDRSSTLLVVGTFGWNAPAHLALGGRVVYGLPVGEGASSLRIAAGFNGWGTSLWDDVLESGAIPMYNVFVRVGTGATL